MTGIWKSAAAAAAMYATLATGTAMAETVWNMPTPYPDTNFHTQNIAKFAEEVKAATGGEIAIKIHSAGSLFKHPDIKRAVHDGLAQAGEVLISSRANEAAVYGLDSVPFLATSYADARKLYGASRAALEKQLASEGLVLLFSVPWPPQGLYSKKEIASVADLKGLKFRTYSPGTGRIAELVGAVPVQVEVPDLPTAFATGRVEATITSGSTGVQARFWEFVTHYHDLQAWLPRNMVFVNKAAWDGLAEGQRTAILAAAKAAEERGWAASEKETAERIGQLKENKLTILSPAPAKLMEELRAIGKTMAAEWQALAGEDGKAILGAFAK